MMLEMVWLKYIKTFNPHPYYTSDRIKTYRFEDIMADHTGQIADICRHWELSEEETDYFIGQADHYYKNPAHAVRDRSPYQYQSIFNDDLNRYFERLFYDLPLRLDYPK